MTEQQLRKLLHEEIEHGLDRVDTRMAGTLTQILREVRERQACIRSRLDEIAALLREWEDAPLETEVERGLREIEQYLSATRSDDD